MTAPDVLALLDDVALQGLAGSRAGRGIETSMEYSRDLTAEDLQSLATAPKGGVDNSPGNIQTIRASHHRLAQLVAAGKPHAEIAGITGKATSTIARYATQDPLFMELVAYYKEAQKEIFLDAQARLADLGTTAVELMQEKLEGEGASKIELKTLREVAEFAFDRSIAPAKGGAAMRGPSGQGGVTLNVSFVSPKAPEGLGSVPPLTIDLTPNKAGA